MGGFIFWNGLTRNVTLRQLLLRLSAWLLPVQAIVLLAALGIAIGGFGAAAVLVTHGVLSPRYAVPPQPNGTHVILPLPSAISPLFTPEVQHWATQIVQWGQQTGIDPNLIATVMQIESCGDPGAASSVGAQGLFQVMPSHFQPDEDPTDPATSARVGLDYLKGALIRANGDIGLALAGYNGGYGVMAGGWDSWVPQTQNYYLWGAGMYWDALYGHNPSPALQSWLTAGGHVLCEQAAARLTATAIPGGS